MYFNFLKKLENSSRYRIIQNDRNEKNKEWIIIIFYFNQRSLWNFIITLFIIVEKNIFDKENSMLVTLFSTSQPNWDFRNFLDVTINKGENFLERFSRIFHDRVDCKISIDVEAHRTRQRRRNCEGGKGKWNSCENSGIRDVDFVDVNENNDGFECSFWNNKIVYGEGNMYLLLTICSYFKISCLCKKKMRKFLW